MITNRQFLIWLIMYEIGSSLLIIPSAIAALAKQDAWIAVILSILLRIAWIPLYGAIANQMNRKSMVRHMTSLFGNWLGKSFCLLYLLLFPYLIFILTLRNLGDFLSNVILIDTPIEIIHVIALASVVYGVWSGIQAVGRAAEILFAGVVLLFVILIFSLLPSIELSNLMPIMENGIKPIIQGSFPLFAFPFMEIVLFLFILPKLERPEKWKSVVYKSSIISGSLFFIVIFIVISVLNAGVTSNLTYPSYFVVRTVSIAGFYERFEVFLAVAWIVTMFFRLSILMFFTLQGVTEIFGLQGLKSLLIPSSIIALEMANIVWPNAASLLELLNVWPYYAMTMGILFPVVLWLVGLRKASTSI